MEKRINGFLKISLRIMLLAIALCLPVPVQAMQALARITRPAARAFSSAVQPAAPVSRFARANLCKAGLLTAGLVGGDKAFAQEAEESRSLSEKEREEIERAVAKMVARKEAEQVPFEKVQSMLFGQQALCKEIYPLQQQKNALRSKIEQLMKESIALWRAGQEGSERDREISKELRDLWDKEHKLWRRIDELKKESKKGTIWEYEQLAINGVKTVASLSAIVVAVRLVAYFDEKRISQLAGEIADEVIRRREDSIRQEAYRAGGLYALQLQEARIAQADQLAENIANEAVRRQADSIWNNGFSAGYDSGFSVGFNNGFSAGISHAIQRLLGPPSAEPTAPRFTRQNPPNYDGA